MSKNLAAGFTVFSVLLVSGCATAPGTTVKQLIERDGVEVGLIPATYREVYFSPSLSKDRHCRAPEPDFTVQQNDQLNMALPVDQGENIGAGESQAALSLGGRSPTVLLTRELMYRACELATNLNADKETSLAIYTQFLQVIESMSQQQLGNGTASASDAPSSLSDGSFPNNNGGSEATGENYSDADAEDISDAVDEDYSDTDSADDI